MKLLSYLLLVSSAVGVKIGQLDTMGDVLAEAEQANPEEQEVALAETEEFANAAMPQSFDSTV